MPHLPSSHDQENTSLSKWPPKDSGIRAFACLTESFLTILQQNKQTLISVFVKNARYCLVARFFQKLISGFAGLTEFFLAILQQFKEIFPFPFQDAFLRMLMKCPKISRFVFVWKQARKGFRPISASQIFLGM